MTAPFTPEQAAQPRVGSASLDHCLLRLDCLRLAAEVDSAKAIDLASRFALFVIEGCADE